VTRTTRHRAPRHNSSPPSLSHKGQAAAGTVRPLPCGLKWISALYNNTRSMPPALAART
jgi:hypothetical protein